MISRLRQILRAEWTRINPFFTATSHSRGRAAPECLHRLVAFLLATALLSGCKTSSTTSKESTDPAKEASTLRLHQEENEIGIGVGKIEVFRANPVKLTVQKAHFTDEGEVVRAQVIDSPYGGIVLQIELTRRGRMLLQMTTAAHPGRRIAIWSRWTEGRWLAAPLIPRAIDDGILAFTPDCTREEAERIVRGINNVAIKLKNQEKPKLDSSSKKTKTKKSDEEEMFK